MKLWGCTGFDTWLKPKVHVAVDQLAALKADQKPNADDDMSDLLAEAEYIFNNADDFVNGVEEDEFALAA